MNIILTGEKQIGKSTALAKVLAALGREPLGFLTRFALSDGQRRLLLLSADGTQSRSAVCWQNGRPHVDLRAFDDFGAALLRADGTLAVMDEIGKFELHADRFREAVERSFDSGTDVLAVVRLETCGWMQALKARTDTVTLMVTEENRSEIPHIVCNLLREKC